MEFSTKKSKRNDSKYASRSPDSAEAQPVSPSNESLQILALTNYLYLPLVLLFMASFLSPLLHCSSLIDRNYMFLVCNGILVFLARNSGFIGRSSSPFKDITDNLEDADEINRENLQLDHLQDFIHPEYSETKYDLEEEEKELEVQLLITQGHDHYEEEDEEDRLLSGDELKKKCDDFINKVKEQIWIEA